MQLYEWTVTASKAGRPGTSPVGITDTAFAARGRMVQALDGVPGGLRARGRVSRLLLSSGRLTYDRVETIARVTRDGRGNLTWEHDAAAGARTRRPGIPAISPMPRRRALIDGERLRVLRRERGLSREKLAWRADVSITTLTRLEQQDRSPCLYQTAERLAEVLGERTAAVLCG
jgi:DNA-binding XRE family transcriptional regulator